MAVRARCPLTSIARACRQIGVRGGGEIQIIDGAALEEILSWEWLAAITQDVDDKVHPK